MAGTTDQGTRFAALQDSAAGGTVESVAIGKGVPEEGDGSGRGRRWGYRKGNGTYELTL